MGDSISRVAEEAIRQASRRPRMTVKNTVTDIVRVDFNKADESEIHNNKLIEDKKKKDNLASRVATKDEKGTYKSKVTIDKGRINNDEESLGVSKTDICNYLEQSSNGKIVDLNKDMLIDAKDRSISSDTKVCALGEEVGKLNDILGTVKTMINNDVDSIGDMSDLVSDSLKVLNGSLNLVNDGVDMINDLQDFVEARIFNYLSSVGVSLDDKISFGGLAKQCSGLKTFSSDFSIVKLHKLTLTMTLSGLLKALLCMGMKFAGDWLKSLDVFDSVMSSLMLLSCISLIAENVNYTGKDATNTTLDILELTNVLYDKSTDEIKAELSPIMKIALDRTILVLNNDTKEPDMEILNKRTSNETLDLLNTVNSDWSKVDGKTNISSIKTNTTLGMLADRNFVNTVGATVLDEDAVNTFDIDDLNNLLFISRVSNRISTTPHIGDIVNFGICNTNVKPYERISCKERIL